MLPVADSGLGRIGMVAWGEVLVPESARVPMLRGAEVLLHPTNEPYSWAEEAAQRLTGPSWPNAARCLRAVAIYAGWA
jgi:predicted amidohydrolase